METKEEKSLEEKEIIKIVISELQKRGLIKEKVNSLVITEKLLMNYNYLKDSILDSKEEIKELEEYGLKGKSGDIIYCTVEGSSQEDEHVIIDRRIRSIEQSIHCTECTLKKIQKLIQWLGGKQSEIINLIYIEGKKGNEVAKLLNCSESIVTRSKQDGIEKIRTRLFPNYYIQEIGN